MAKRKRGRRNRERRTPKVVAEGVWVWDGRPAVRARLTSAGRLRVVAHLDRADSVGREHAAHWLREHFLPRLSHEDCYQMLWGEGGA